MRRAMGKKKKEEMALHEEKFIQRRGRAWDPQREGRGDLLA
jgi:DNA polymerase III alpha subunit